MMLFMSVELCVDVFILFMGSLYELRSTLFCLKLDLKLLPLEEFDESDQQFACYSRWLRLLIQLSMLMQLQMSLEFY